MADDEKKQTKAKVEDTSPEISDIDRKLSEIRKLAREIVQACDERR